MTSILTRLRDESGQAIVFVAALLFVLFGTAGLVIDVGSWYHADRKLQTAADAGALAGAQELPSLPSTAVDVARDYGNRNGSGLDALVITPQTRSVSGTQQDTIRVAGSATAPGFFSRVISSVFNNVTVNAEAEAQVQTPHLEGVAPIGIPESMACTVPSCFGPGHPVTMALNENDVPDRTKFGLLNLDSGSNPSANNPGASTLGGWLQGYADALPVNTYYTVAEGNKNGLKNDIDNVLHRTLLFPVFDPDRSNPDFYVIGWAAFVIDARGAWDGHSHVLTGHFVTFKREDLQFDGGTPGGTYFGVPLVITLIK